MVHPFSKRPDSNRSNRHHGVITLYDYLPCKSPGVAPGVLRLLGNVVPPQRSPSWTIALAFASYPELHRALRYAVFSSVNYSLAILIYHIPFIISNKKGHTVMIYPLGRQPKLNRFKSLKMYILHYIVNAGDRTWTCTSGTLEPKSSASANSATPANATVKLYRSAIKKATTFFFFISFLRKITLLLVRLLPQIIPNIGDAHQSRH